MLIEQDPTWANVLGGVLSAINGLAQGRQQKYDRQQQQQDDAQRQALVQAQLQSYGTENQLNQQRLAQGQQDIAQAGKVRSFQAGLQLPKGWANMTPDQKIAYYQQRQTAAQRIGDIDTVNATQAEINKLTDVSKAAIQDSVRQWLDIYNQTQQNTRTNMVTSRDIQLNADTTARILMALGIRGGQQYGIESMRENAAGLKAAQGQANKATNDIDTFVSNGILALGKANDQNQALGRSPQNPNMGAFAAGLKQNIAAVKKNPGLADQITQKILSSSMSDTQKALALEAIRRAAAAAALQAQAAGIGKASGGSNAAPGPW